MLSLALPCLSRHNIMKLLKLLKLKLQLSYILVLVQTKTAHAHLHLSWVGFLIFT